MNLHFYNQDDAFVKYTESVIENPRQYHVSFSWKLFMPVKSSFANEVDKVFPDRIQKRMGKHMTWSEYLIETVFPVSYYKKSGSLLKMLSEYPELSQTPSFGFNAYNAMITRAFRERKYGNFLEYTVNRFKKGKNYAALPVYYFDVESPEWIFEELMKNPNQIKTGRMSLSCMTNLSIRYDSKLDEIYVISIIKHNDWSHLYGDIYGLSYFAEAFLKEIEYSSTVVCGLYMVSSFLYKKSDAVKLLEAINEVR